LHKLSREGTAMPRLRYIEESEKTPHGRELIESAERTGAPDPRVVSTVEFCQGVEKFLDAPVAGLRAGD